VALFVDLKRTIGKLGNQELVLTVADQLDVIRLGKFCFEIRWVISNIICVC